VWFEEASSPVVRDCAFLSNRVAGIGGGLAVDLDVSLSVFGCTFEGNSAGSGGGITISSSSAVVADCEISENSATFGGAVCLMSATGVQIVGTEMSSNTADLQGGGIYSSDSSFEVTGSAITGNTAGSAGGAAWLLNSDGLVTRTVVADNSTPGLAGGFFLDASPTTISSCEITGNGLALYVVAPARSLADARMNWWGSSTGPYHPVLNPAGQGDEVGDSVLFDPWNVAADAPALPEVISSTWGAIKATHR
jgi:predicted outer membrane repeat protein